MTDRVLLIDDDANVLMALTRTLRKRFDIATAASGQQAIEMVVAALDGPGRFAVAVCDMHMPGMDGMTTLERLRALDPALVGVMLTGDGDRNTAIDALNGGNIFRFYSKPFDCNLLSDGIAASLHQNHLLRAERLLAENEERWRLALEAVGDGVWDWDCQTGSVFFSRSWWRMLNGETPAGNAPLQCGLDRVHPDDLPHLQTLLTQLLDGTISTMGHEHRLRCEDHSFRWFLMRGVALFHDGQGRALRVIGTHTDISQRREMEDLLRRQAEELTILATTDSLTGLLNRRCFLEKAEAEWQRSQRYQRSLAIIMVDIDFFKRVNDTYGHAAGDVVLRKVTEALGSNKRATDILGRLGGEEFALLLPESAIGGAQVVADSLRKIVADHPVPLPDGTMVPVTASFGVACSGRANDSIKDILNRADEALYDAKQSGRNQVKCHDN